MSSGDKGLKGLFGSLERTGLARKFSYRSAAPTHTPVQKVAVMRLQIVFQPPIKEGGRRRGRRNRETTSTDLPFIPVIRLRRVCSGASLGTHFIIMKQTKS